jgi:hypothetical protein
VRANLRNSGKEFHCANHEGAAFEQRPSFSLWFQSSLGKI